MAAAAIAAVGGALSAAPAVADTPVEIGPEHSVLSGTTISVKEPDTRPEILDRVLIYGDVPVPQRGQPVALTVWRNGKKLRSVSVHVDPIDGRYRHKLELADCCKYMVQAAYGGDRSDPLLFEVEPPQALEPGPQALLFNRLLDRHGYHMESVSRYPDESTSLGILALRKANDMVLTDEYAPSLFRYLLRGRGDFVPVHDDPGRHVEVDISRQVMALVEDGEVEGVFGVSSGSGGTPRGEFIFYSKVPGYNAIGMYYSVFYDGEYATHGFASVPTYPASHGCIRTPIAHAEYIYNWISIGDPIYIYD